MFRIFLSNEAAKSLKRAEPWLRSRLHQLGRILAENPIPRQAYDVQKLEGTEDGYRIRLSAYRIKYRVLEEENEIRIIKIERRDETTYSQR